MSMYLFPPADRTEKKAGGSGGRHAPQYRKTSIIMIVYMKNMFIYVFLPVDRSENKAGVPEFGLTESLIQTLGGQGLPGLP